MKRILALAVLVCPAAAYAETTYTNADLARFQVPGAYTNEDLKRLPPSIPSGPAVAPPAVVLPVAPISRYQAEFDTLARARRALAIEYDLELERLEASESYFAGNAYELTLRPGHRAQVRRLILELEKRIAILDARIEATRDLARRAGEPVDARELTW